MVGIFGNIFATPTEWEKIDVLEGKEGGWQQYPKNLLKSIHRLYNYLRLLALNFDFINFWHLVKDVSCILALVEQQKF